MKKIQKNHLSKISRNASLRHDLFASSVGILCSIGIIFFALSIGSEMHTFLKIIMIITFCLTTYTLIYGGIQAIKEELNGEKISEKPLENNFFLKLSRKICESRTILAFTFPIVMLFVSIFLIKYSYMKPFHLLSMFTIIICLIFIYAVFYTAILEIEEQ